MVSVQDKLKALIAQAIGVESQQIKLEHPEVEEHGDYSTNIALVLKGGRKLAEEITSKIKAEFIEKVEVAGPGFINMRLKQTALLDGMHRASELPDTKKGKRIVIEYTDPNPFKEFHVGHLISNVTGEALCRLQEGIGAIVWRADYFGDVGVHVAKSIWGIRKNMAEDKMNLETLAKKSLVERVKYMGEGYAMASRVFETDEVAKNEIGRLNTVLYMAAQKMWREEGRKSVINYDPEGKIAQNEIDDVYELYKTGRAWSLEYFETLYKRLGTKFDGYYPESSVAEVGHKLVADNVGKVFEKSEGAVIFRGEKFGLHTRVFINKHNLPTYEAKELGLAPTKYQDFKYDESVIVVGTEIKEYFMVLVEALKQINPKLGNVTKPICTGMVTIPGGKMSSRKGNVITVTGLLDTLREEVEKRMKGDYSKAEVEEIADKVAVGSLKYAFLKVGVGQNVVFDIQRSLSLDGNSGPYLQYTYARTQSVLKKAGEIEIDLSSFKGELNTEELAVVRWVYRFSEVVEEAAVRYAPNLVCNFLYELAQRYNGFYNKCPILTADKPQEKEFRLALTAAVGEVLKKGLNLLGIEALERM